MARLDDRTKINPPFRPGREVEVLWAHLSAGHVTVVSTDHVGWSEERETGPNMLRNTSEPPSLDAGIGVVTPCRYHHDPRDNGHALTSWSPDGGMQLNWRIEATFMPGQPVFDGRDILAASGRSRFVRVPA